MFGFGRLKSVRFEWLQSDVANVTLGLHGQQWLSTPTLDGRRFDIHELTLGFFFFRFVFEFIDI